MNTNAHRLDGMDANARRELLARLLRERATGSGEEFELSSGQEALWFLHELAPDSAAYNVAFCARVRSEVDPELLERALLKLMERHPMLRCTVVGSAQAPWQRIGPVPEHCLEIVDASGLEEEGLRALVNETYARPFDLAAGPVFRCTLFSLCLTEHVLLLSVHHVFSDAWSFGILVSDLMALYQDPTALFPLPPAAYSDYVRWQRAALDSLEGRQAWEYWQGRLKDLPSTRLPSDYPRPKVQGFRGDSHHFEVPKDLCDAIRTLARAHDATPFMVVAAALHALLVRYCGSSVVPIGTPLFGRPRREDEGTVGYFINPVVIFAPVQPGTTFRQHIADIRTAAIGAQRFGEFPFPELVKRFQPMRDTSEMPIFQVMLNLIKGSQLAAYKDLADADAQITVGSLVLQDFPLNQQQGQFDLDLELFDAGGAMQATFKYRTDLFEQATIERMAANFLTLLSAAIAHPELRVSDLPILTDTERNRIVVDWNATAKPLPETTIHRLIEEQVRRTPEATALAFEGRTMSYGELNHRANQLARRLRQLGIGPDALVAVCLERSFEMVVALLGILKAGGAYVPIDPHYPSERQAYMIGDCEAPVILTQAALAEAVEQFGACVLTLDAGWEEIGREPGGDLDGGAEPDQLAYMIYTSGSTGKPKGAMNTHRGVCNRLLWMQETYQLTASDRVLQKTPFSFDVSVWEFFWPLLTGARLVIARPEGHKDPAYLVSLIKETGITTLHFVPSMLRVFLEADDVLKCTTVKRVICSGEALPYELQERFFKLFQAELHNLYGPTEAAVDVTYWKCRRGDQWKVVPIGSPVANTQIYVLDAQLQPVPIGVPGELFIGGVQVGRGYWHRPELTAERFIADPFRAEGRLYKTGDLARWRPDGAVEYLGRMDFQVKIRGFRIELGEIEAQLSKYPDVREAVVIACEDTPGDMRLVAYYTSTLNCGSGEAVDTNQLRSYLSASLPDYMVPTAYVHLDALPLSPNGKLDRRAMPAPNADAVRTRTYEPPQGEMETRLADMWGELLRVARVGRRDNFFDLGGHSLLAMQLAARLRAGLGIDLSVRHIFERPTVAGLSTYIQTIQWSLPVAPVSVGAEFEHGEL